MNNEIKIKNGELDLLTSGTFIINENLPTSLILAGEEEKPIELRIKFEKNSRDLKKQETKTNFVNEHLMDIIFVNFNNQIGTYGTGIWQLGSLKKRVLYFYYIVRDLAHSELKELGYTFYLGEEEKNG